MWKKLFVFCFVVSLLVTVGWGTRDEAFGAAKRYKMVFIVKSMDNPFWNMMLEGAQMAAKDLGLEIKGLAPIKPNNVEEQIRQMEDAITAKMDAIIVVPSDSKGIVPGIEKANRAGIPVFTSNTTGLWREVHWLCRGSQRRGGLSRRQNLSGDPGREGQCDHSGRGSRRPDGH